MGGESQSVSTGAFNWGARAVSTREALQLGERESRVAASHDGYRARFGVLHRRDLRLSGVDGLRVQDDVLGVGRQRVRLIWHFGERVSLRTAPDGRSWALVLGEQTPGEQTLALLRLEGPALTPTVYRGVDRPGPGGSSPAYNTLVPCDSLVLEGEVDLPASWVSSFEFPKV